MKRAATRVLLRAGRRLLSSNEPGPVPKPKDGVSATAEALSLFPKKYLAVIVPLLSFGILTTAVINNRALKEFVEGLSPEYIDFVRKQFGFEEEDVDEEQRVQQVLLSNSQPIDVVATCTAPGQPPRHVSLAAVDGSRPVSELLELIGAQLEEGPSLQAPWRVSLAFSDSSDETARQNFARESGKIEAHFARKFRAPVEGDADGAYLQTPPPTQLHCWQESEWAGSGPSAAQLRAQRAACLRLGQPGQPPERLVLVVPCHSAGAELVRSLYTYLQCSTSIGSGSGSRNGNSSAQAGIFGAVSRSAVAAARAASAWRPSARSLALERIADLDRRIGTLRKELQGHAGGMKITREIDAIQEDVVALQRQITALRRSHINWFYYF